MQAKITYLLTEQAQRAAMAATGQPVARKQTMTVELGAEDLSLLPVNSDGSIDIDTSGYSSIYAPPLQAAGWAGWNGGSGAAANVIDPPFLADLRRGNEILAEQDRERKVLAHANGEHNRAATEAAYQAFMANPAARIEDIRRAVSDLLSPADWWPESHSEFRAEMERRDRADRAAKAAAAAALEAAKVVAIADWVRDHGTDNQRARLADDLLPRREILSAIADWAFGQAGVPEQWAPKICDNSRCKCGESDITALDEPSYDAWRKIREGLPEGTTFGFIRVRECLRLDDNEYEMPGPADPVTGVRITMPWGPFQFERTVKLA